MVLFQLDDSDIMPFIVGIVNEMIWLHAKCTAYESMNILLEQFVCVRFTMNFGMTKNLSKSRHKCKRYTHFPDVTKKKEKNQYVKKIEQNVMHLRIVELKVAGVIKKAFC